MSSEAIEYFVYIIQYGKKGAIKVGISKDVQSRIATLQTGCPAKLIELARIPCRNERDARNMEKMFHYKFRAFRKHGEWFEKEALKMIPKRASSYVAETVVNMELDRRHMETVSHLL